MVILLLLTLFYSALSKPCPHGADAVCLVLLMKLTLALGGCGVPAML